MQALLQSIELWSSQHQNFWFWVGGVSIFLFIASILSLPWLVSLIPSNYFTKRHKPLSIKDLRPSRLFIFIIKNIIGIILIALGILMLVLPGQGVITIIAGIILTNFPGKFTVERWIIQKENVYKTINWLRRGKNKDPLDKPKHK